MLFLLEQICETDILPKLYLNHENPETDIMITGLGGIKFNIPIHHFMVEKIGKLFDEAVKLKI